MKAWSVTDRNCNGCSLVIFAETRGKAIAYATHFWEFEDYTFTGLMAHREPELDAFYDGRRMMDWENEKDRIAMVRLAGYYCSYELEDGDLECADCPAKQWCSRYERRGR